MKKTHTFFLFLVLSVSLSAQTYSVNDVPNRRTADAANSVSNPNGILNDTTVQQINALLQSLEADTQAEAAVVMLNSIGSEEIEDFGVRLFAKWGIGKKKLDNGLLILFVLDQRAIRFEVGYGLEGVLTDGICKRIQTQAMIPEFKNGNYDAGILAGVACAAACIRKEPLPEKYVSLPEEDTSSLSFLDIVFIIVIVLIWMWLNAGSSKSRSDRGGSSYGGGSSSSGSYGGGSSGGGGSTSRW